MGAARRTAPAALVAALALGALTLTSCSLVLDSGAPQCASTADCVGRGASFASAICVDTRCVAAPAALTSAAGGESAADAASLPDAAVDAPTDPWACVGNVVWDAPTTVPIVEHTTFRDVEDGHGVAGLVTHVCGHTDLDCDKPIATTTTDADGKADIPLTKGFRGYLQMKPAPDSQPGIMPMILPFFPPLYADATSEKPVASAGDVSALAAAVGAEIDPSRAVLVVLLTNCDGRRADGIQVELAGTDGKAVNYYYRDGLPVFGATATDSSGQVAMINVASGIVTVTSRRALTGAIVGTETVHVRAATITVLTLPPTPL